MTREQAYNILYKDGSCYHSTDVVKILTEVIMQNWMSNTNLNIMAIDRWNIYGDSDLHIVYTILGSDTSTELICPISEFTDRYLCNIREEKLNELLK